MATRLENKVAVITGAGGGIGAEMAALFAREGSAVVVCDVAREKAQQVMAGICASGEEADWDATLAVCLKGPFLCTKRAVPMMRERGGGSVVTMSSVNALFGIGETAYTASKGGLIALMRLVAAEYGNWNIRSNVICPGTIGTEICLDYWRQFPLGFAKLQEMYPLGRIGTPREVANLALFLASDESSFITGSVQVIDGGLLAGRKFEVG
jgi:NAD(P)-dependent dehydrogenase (short-subunit alcohol dehydrogenase family)